MNSPILDRKAKAAKKLLTVEERFYKVVVAPYVKDEKQKEELRKIAYKEVTK